jgi:hypothetical protein
VFNYLSGYAQPEGLETLAISPLTLKDRLISLIAAEADHARAGRPAARHRATSSELMSTHLPQNSPAASMAARSTLTPSCSRCQTVPQMSVHCEPTGRWWPPPA